ncbi:MAG: enoyl-CoA hydratase/isomerase family protein [Microthrixaceae bacterium]
MNSDSDAEVLLTEDDGGARVLTLNRPNAKNAFNQALWYALADAMEEAARDDSIRCVVLTGTGDAFSAGQDLGEMTDPSVFENSEPGYLRLMPVVETFPKPLIAAVNGVGVGIGLTILLHCDIAFISTAARLKAPFISLGVTTEASASLLMPLAMGRQRAAEVLYTEPWLDADAAVADGLALRSYPPDELMPATMDLARHIGSLPLGPLIATRTLLNRSRSDAVAEARRAEYDQFVHLISKMGSGGA